MSTKAQLDALVATVPCIRNSVPSRDAGSIVNLNRGNASFSAEEDGGNNSKKANQSVDAETKRNE